MKKRNNLIVLFLLMQIPVLLAQNPTEMTGSFSGGNAISQSISKQKISIASYPSYAEYESLMHNFAMNYPGICRLDTFKTLSSGRRLLMLVIDDNPDQLEQEPVFFYTSTMHGDETVGYILMLNLIDTLLKSYGSVNRITNLVDDVKICINPLANPDGTYAGGNSSVSGATRFNSNSVDLNRNFPDPEDGMHPDGNVWQEETEGFMVLADSLGFHISANLHSGNVVVNYPWDTWNNTPANEDWWLLIGHEYADSAQFYGPSGYFSSAQFPNGVTKGYDWYSISGGRQDYMNYYHYCREMTLELSMQKLLPESELPVMWEANRRSLLNYISQAKFGVSGTVSDSLSGLPLKAKIYISNFDVDSSHAYSRATDGYYHRYLASGNYTLTYSAPGYVSKDKTMTVSNYQKHAVNVQLVPDNVLVSSVKKHPFQVYPNPADDLINVEMNIDPQQEILMELRDLTGKTIKTLRLNTNEKIASLPIENIPPGIYLIQIQSDQYRYTDKIIIQ